MTAPSLLNPSAACVVHASGTRPAPTDPVGVPGVALTQPRGYAALNCAEQIFLTVARLAGLGFRFARAIGDLAGPKPPSFVPDALLMRHLRPRVVTALTVNNLPVHSDHRCPSSVSEQSNTEVWACASKKPGYLIQERGR